MSQPDEDSLCIERKMMMIMMVMMALRKYVVVEVIMK